MRTAPSGNAVRSVPKNSRKRISYNEDANEASGLVLDEAVDLERETADRGNQAIEHTEPDDGSINRSTSSCTFLLTGRSSSDSEGR